METFYIALAILATYRLAQLFPYDDGPFYVFKRVRIWLEIKKQASHILEKDHLSFWPMINDLATCPYCWGLYIAAAWALLIATNPYEFLLFWFAISGGQALLQRWNEK